jgi:hypothetical protein
MFDRLVSCVRIWRNSFLFNHISRWRRFLTYAQQEYRLKLSLPGQGYSKEAEQKCEKLNTTELGRSKLRSVLVGNYISERGECEDYYFSSANDLNT